MKNYSLSSITAIAFVICTNFIFAQNWRVGGNTNAQLGGNPPIIGTTQNNPLNFITNNVQRMKLNGSVTYNINGFNAARDGYLWLGPDAPTGTGTYYNNKEAFSMLHLNGTTTLAAIELGYRPWMKTGVLKVNLSNP